jgi:hypothetical protein
MPKGRAKARGKRKEGAGTIHASVGTAIKRVMYQLNVLIAATSMK